MYNRKRIRLYGFDYSSMRNYFITIIVKGHIHSFGKIADKNIKLSRNGIIALEQWYWLGARYPFIDLISFVIMPDHVHGIIHINSNYYIDYDGMCIGNNDGDKQHNTDGDKQHNTDGDKQHNTDGNEHNDSTNHNVTIRKISKIKSLPELIGAYKTTVSKRIHLEGDLDFKWQNSYHDHIIRNEQELNRIKCYIEKNPENWV